MLFNPTLILSFLLSFSSIVTALPTDPPDARLEPRLASADYICETSAASPPSSELYRALPYFSSSRVGDSCARGFPLLKPGPNCLTPVRIFKARVSICNSYGKSLSCKDVATHAGILANKCEKFIDGVRKVGGKVLLPKGVVINVYTGT
ncbi:hypothetical protein C7212DRAFT_305007 [Tuber magnatum]|uniref:Uncharacterized protein n=1 Tax=Tuber magnatum TaxID=42249 RepID=A0A317SWN1_9PEZI|nr:hypothetical protein C7212DRAFT_305007 [Tuber magnatum]